MTAEEDDVNDHPIEEVRLTVSTADDPTIPSLTFRTWVLGLVSCLVLSFMNQFFSFRSNALYIGSVSVQIMVLPLGKLMAAVLPRNPGPFSLNPGPFNLKEHVLITIFANCGASGAPGLTVVAAVRAFYHRHIDLWAALLLILTTQLLGYGWAGMFRKYLVDSPHMWWPSNLVQVSLFRALHETEKRDKGGHTRLQFFTLVCVSSFAYYILPGYLFPSLSTVSFICWIWKDSITAQQIGSGLNGLGVGSFGLDWSTVAGFLGSPLATPLFAILCTMGGFSMVVYIILPIVYWNNALESRRFPMLSQETYDSTGQVYNITRIMNEKGFDINVERYEGYSKLYLSATFVIGLGFGFASLMAAITHVALFNGKEQWKKTTTGGGAKDEVVDVHTRMMRKSYEAVPQWWFTVIMIVSLALSFFAIEGFNQQLQLPWWALILACALAFALTLPSGIILATTNQPIYTDVIAELLIGYIYPGKPLANITFKAYSFISTIQALSFLSDFKLGHYMKIPPKSMFLVQIVGTLVGSTAQFATTWSLISSIDNICGSPWTCPGYDYFYTTSILWGVVGPRRILDHQGIYSYMKWFFLIGTLAPIPVWMLARKYPEKKWIESFHVPIFLSGAYGMLPARPVHFLSWGAVGVFFNYYVYRKYKGWWARHTYILSAALDAGVAFMAVLVYFTLQSKDVYGPEWWGLEAGDHCSLAKCPTVPGIVVDGCPAIY
ncbi:Oligopeptide transporter 5 [Linum perenne]